MGGETTARDADEGTLIFPTTSFSPARLDAESTEEQNQRKHQGSCSRQWLLLIVQLLCLAGAGSYCLYATTLEPVAVGFFCNDDSIRFPLMKQTVPALEALLIAILFPLFFLLLVDWIATREFGGAFCFGSSVDLGCCRAPPLLRGYYRSIGGFLFSMLCAYAVTITGKICVGRLRPHFIAACLPDWTKVRCSDETGFLYIDKFQCTSRDTAAIKEARVSFPSGHSSSAMCAMVYLALFLQSRLVWLDRSAGASKSGRSTAATGGYSSKITRALWRTLKGLCPFLQLLAFAVAFFIGLSRIRDRYHHPTDVLGGFLIGFIAAVYGAFYIAGFGFWRHAAENKVEHEDIDLAV